MPVVVFCSPHPRMPSPYNSNVGGDWITMTPFIVAGWEGQRYVKVPSWLSVNVKLPAVVPLKSPDFGSPVSAVRLLLWSMNQLCVGPAGATACCVGTTLS